MEAEIACVGCWCTRDYRLFDVGRGMFCILQEIVDMSYNTITSVYILLMDLIKGIDLCLWVYSYAINIRKYEIVALRVVTTDHLLVSAK